MIESELDGFVGEGAFGGGGGVKVFGKVESEIILNEVDCFYGIRGLKHVGHGFWNHHKVFQIG